MCDASDYAMGVVLGQITKKIFRDVYYASKTFNEAYHRKGDDGNGVCL